MKLSSKKIIDILLIPAIVIIVGVLAFFIVGIFVIGDRHKEREDEVTVQAAKPALGRYYFDFDEVVYYSIKVEDDPVYDAADRHRKRIVSKAKTPATAATDKDSLISDFIFDYLPATINDTSFEKGLLKIGYTSKKLGKDKLKELKEVFREKGSDMGDVACIAIYRDIYVFKKNGKISGIAKLCYDCGMSHFIGTSADTGNFGAEGEFEKLRELVK
jgi:flagellar basal body-associated protein FliL